MKLLLHVNCKTSHDSTTNIKHNSTCRTDVDLNVLHISGIPLRQCCAGQQPQVTGVYIFLQSLITAKSVSTPFHSSMCARTYTVQAGCSMPAEHSKQQMSYHMCYRVNWRNAGSLASANIQQSGPAPRKLSSSYKCYRKALCSSTFGVQMLQGCSRYPTLPGVRADNCSTTLCQNLRTKPRVDKARAT